MGLGLALASIGGVGSAAFSPISRSPALWYETTAGVTTVGGNATAWADQSGNGNNAAQSGTGPTFNATDAAVNNQPSISLLGTARLLNSAAGFTVTQPNTIYVVGYISAASGEIFDGGVTRQTIGKNAGGTWQYFAGGSVFAGGTANNAAHVFCGIFNGNINSALYVDNSTTAVLTGGNPGTNSMVQLSIPGSVAGANGGAITEIIIISGADTQPQRLQMFTYLGAKYGIATS